MAKSEADKIMELMQSDPQGALDMLDRMDAEESLVDFIRQSWHVLEPPSRKYIHNWHIDAIADHLTAITNDEINRLIINVPPGAMKSLTVSALWPAWEWGPRKMPGQRYVRFSYANHLSERDNVKTQYIINSPYYQKNWGDVFRPDKKNWGRTKFSNDKTGFSFATGVTGVGTGERGDRLILDDVHNVSDAESDAIRNATVRWFDETLQTRVNDPDKSAIVVIMQRVHVKDVSGHILAKELGYEHLCLPMEFDSSRTCYTFVGKGGIRSDTPVRQDPRTEEKELMWPERFSRDYLKDLYKGMTQYAVSGQMQQLPVPREGGMLKYADFKIVKAAPAGGSEVRGWDLAASETSRADFTASVKMRRVDGKIYILYADRFRAGPDKVRRRMLNTASQDGKACKISFPQDPGQAGKAQAQSLSSNLMGYDVHSSTESGSKLIRIEPFAAQLEAGNVYLVEGEWNESYLQEMCNFPSNDFDDQVDATSRAFARLCQLRTDNVVIFPISLKNPIGVNPNG